MERRIMPWLHGKPFFINVGILLPAMKATGKNPILLGYWKQFGIAGGVPFVGPRLFPAETMNDILKTTADKSGKLQACRRFAGHWTWPLPCNK